MADAAPSRFAQARDTIRRLGPAGVVAVIASTVPPLGSIVVIAAIPKVAPWMQDRPVAGPAMALLAAVVLGGTMFMPTYSFAALCGAAFGPVQGTLIAVIGIVLGGFVNVLWTRPICGTRILELIDERPKLAAIHRELLRSNPRRTFFIMTLVRIPPGFPFSLTNFMVAALHVPMLIILGSILIGSIPRTAIVAAAANHISENARNPWTWVLTIGSTLALLFIISHLGSKAIARVTAQAETAPPIPPAA